LDCRDEASAATTRAYEIGYLGSEDRAIDAYKSTFNRCMLGHLPPADLQVASAAPNAAAA
jgi:hypothetical protein